MRRKSPDPVAAAMVAKRWKKTTKQERSDLGRALAAARWKDRDKTAKPAAA